VFFTNLLHLARGTAPKVPRRVFSPSPVRGIYVSPPCYRDQKANESASFSPDHDVNDSTDKSTAFRRISRQPQGHFQYIDRMIAR
jgi:hypothetical protein